jgi:hypothetical protein
MIEWIQEWLSPNVTGECPTCKVISILSVENVVVCWVDECRLVKVMRLIDNELMITPIQDGIEADHLGLSWTLIEPPRVANIVVMITVQSHSVVRLYCRKGSVFYCGTVLLYY